MWTVDRHPASGQSTVVVDGGVVHGGDQRVGAAEVSSALPKTRQPVAYNIVQCRPWNVMECDGMR